MTAPPTDIAIVIDGAADTPATERRPGTWVVVPDVYHSGNHRIEDTGEHDWELTNLVLRKAPVQPAAPDAEQFRAAYDSLEGREVFSLHASHKVSPAVEAARSAAAGHDNVTVIETSAAGIAVGLLATRLQQLAQKGLSLDELRQYANLHAGRVRLVAVPDRIDPVASRRVALRRLLHGHIVASDDDGGLHVLSRAHTRGRTLNAVGQYYREHLPTEGHVQAAIGHADAAGAVEPVIDLVERIHQRAEFTLVGRVGPRIAQKVRSRCVALAWLVE